MSPSLRARRYMSLSQFCACRPPLPSLARDFMSRSAVPSRTAAAACTWTPSADCTLERIIYVKCTRLVAMHIKANVQDPIVVGNHMCPENHTLLQNMTSEVSNTHAFARSEANHRRCRTPRAKLSIKRRACSPPRRPAYVAHFDNRSPHTLNEIDVMLHG